MLLICFLRTVAALEYTMPGLLWTHIWGQSGFTTAIPVKSLNAGKRKNQKQKRKIRKIRVSGRLAILKNDLPAINKTLEKLKRKLVIMN